MRRASSMRSGCRAGRRRARKSSTTRPAARTRCTATWAACWASPRCGLRSTARWRARRPTIPCATWASSTCCRCWSATPEAPRAGTQAPPQCADTGTCPAQGPVTIGGPPGSLCPAALDYGTTFTGGSGAGELVKLRFDTAARTYERQLPRHRKQLEAAQRRRCVRERQCRRQPPLSVVPGPGHHRQQRQPRQGADGGGQARRRAGAAAAARRLCAALAAAADGQCRR
ncbi:hypothetical protein CBM2623_A10075 [Cupriavidus taiwanensis]|nr:hypothetical protein CBM2608_A10072 [Cupriavidus taiwanensis]SPA25341.1 hypothetical protein CBM2623_A10075 [Cupriavidus taiwanensis]SPA43768.1 hypothetical protein CBM2629_A10071 [Cupriavidus taiwanensis]